MNQTDYQILLTNDDGIQSPGLWAAAAVLSELGYVHVVAPRDQFSGAGRSLPSNSDGIISARQMQVNGKAWTVYSVGGTPAQAVLHGMLEILPKPPDLVVSGINYGENVGWGVTVSGTVGAALEAAGRGIPALAISLETDVVHHLSYSTEVDFSTAAHFTHFFARAMLARKMPEDVHVLKVDVPCGATPQTPWEVTRLARQAYYEPTAASRPAWDQPGPLGYRLVGRCGEAAFDSDVYALCVRGVISVTPLSLDLTSRVPLDHLDSLLRQE
jgi:5'-nucleotidase